MIPSGVSRRIESCIDQYLQKDYEGALIHLFPAIDKTALRRRPKTKVGERIRSFFSDEMSFITAISTGGSIGGIEVNGQSIESALYKFGRTSVMHEGEIDPRLSFTDNEMTANKDDWRLPHSFILGMTLAVIAAPENSKEKLNSEFYVDLHGYRLILNECWGNPSPIHRTLNAKFGRDIF